MTDAPRIRQVSVEFLRPGPSHNQLLSPYTQYLAVCNDAGAAVVTVPYEQRGFERRLKELRYETGDQRDRLDLLHEIGRTVGQILEAVPGVPGALMNDASSSQTLLHVRLTLSAAELALLPFELAEVPSGSAASALSIQVRPPVSITRHIRTVPSEGLVWDTRPRVLFVSSHPEAVPYAAHRDALVEAIRSFQYPVDDDLRIVEEGRHLRFGELLTILVDPTLAELQRVCEADAYTHVHVLTHGDLDPLSNEHYGIVLRGESGEPEVVLGERFVSAITRIGHRPSVVTIASCDSGNVGSVVVPGASFAHAIHQAGIPFVVGSQFPLSKEGSIPLASRLYRGLLWGDHPLRVIQQARAELHARFNSKWHDWASVIVYESLPAALDTQLDELRYSQAKRALQAALQRIDRAVESDAVTDLGALRELNQAVTDALARLPFDGAFAVECMGMRASSRKRLAQAAFTLAGHTNRTGLDAFADPYYLLEQAQLDYARAAKGLLVNDARAVQRNATLHWVLVQFVSLAAVVERPSAGGEWETARLSAEYYRDHESQEERAWAHGSLAELHLLRLADPALTPKEREAARAAAIAHTDELNRLYPGDDAFPVKSTRSQFERYVRWWGTDRFGDGLLARGMKRRETWALAPAAASASPGAAASVDPAGDARALGLLKTAEALAAMLERRRQSTGGTALRPVPVTPTVPLPPADPPDPAPAPGVAPAPPAQDASTPSDRPQKRSTGASTHDGAFFTIEALPAGHGDCLWIEYGDRSAVHRVLIDCGTQSTAKALLARVEKVPEAERFLELFVLSHIDSDHIGGAVPFFKAIKRGLRVGDVWFNGWKHVSGQLGARQGEMFSRAIEDFKLPWNQWRNGETIMTGAGDLPRHVLPGGMELTLLSPTRAQLEKLQPVWTRELKNAGLVPGGRVDYSKLLRGTATTVDDVGALADIDALADVPFGGDNGAPNGTSIAVLAEFAGVSVLFGADAHAPVLVDAIQKITRARGAARLKLDLFKVSHHGSQNNVSTALLELLDCPRYLISTNGDHFFHPDRQAIARIFKYGGSRKTLYFNYNNRFNQVWGDPRLKDVREKYGCETVYPEADAPGLTLSLL